MIKRKYNNGSLQITDEPEGVKAWTFIPPDKPRINNLELVELNIKTKDGLLTGNAYFIKRDNIFQGTGELMIEDLNDETKYLLSSESNKKRLLDSLDQAENPT